MVDQELVENNNFNDYSNDVSEQNNVNNGSNFNEVKLPKLTIKKIFGDPSK